MTEEKYAYEFATERCYFNGIKTPENGGFNLVLDDFLSDLKSVFDKYGIKSIHHGNIGYIPHPLAEFIFCDVVVRGEDAK